MIRIISESSIAAGIRRIEAISGARVERMLDELQDTSKEILSILGGSSDIKTAVRKAIDENADLRHQVDEFMAERIANLSNRLISEASEINGIKVITLTGTRLPDVVKNVAFTIRKESPVSTVFIGATESENKPLLTVMISDDLVKTGLNASSVSRGVQPCK